MLQQLLCPIFVGLAAVTWIAAACQGEDSSLSQSPAAWTTGGPRAELLPKFSSSDQGGPAGGGLLTAASLCTVKYPGFRATDLKQAKQSQGAQVERSITSGWIRPLYPM